MSIEESKQLVRRFYAEVVDGGDYSNLDDLVAIDYVDHNTAEGSRGPEVVRTHHEAIRMTLPDFTLQIEDIFAEGDHVITRVTGRGTHLGEWMGIKPTGREVRLKGINIDRVARGRIAEHWGEADTIGMLMQMGVDPFVGRMEEADQGRVHPRPELPPRRSRRRHPRTLARSRLLDSRPYTSWLRHHPGCRSTPCLGPQRGKRRLATGGRQTRLRRARAHDQHVGEEVIQHAGRSYRPVVTVQHGAGRRCDVHPGHPGR